MEYDFSFFIIAAAAMVFSGISKAGFGSGASFAGASLLSIFIDPAVALGITLPLFMLADVVALPPFWNKWSWPTAKPIVLGSLPGVVLGVFLYSSADADLLRILLGLISLAFYILSGSANRGSFLINTAEAVSENWRVGRCYCRLHKLYQPCGGTTCSCLSLGTRDGQDDISL